jgi:serine/threonine-protein kinase|tara:strand:- start:325 stop:1266 length:942 start_codon:yes stop_codon:yes gene_type:complete
MTNKKQHLLYKGEEINNTYEVIFFIGEGAFGEVYRVKHKFFDEFQVMKVFKNEYVEKTDLNEVVNEGRILTRLSHPNVVKVFDINTFNKNGKDHYFITMSFVSGESLTQLVKRKIQLDVPVAISIMIDVLKGLTSAHKNNPTIIHRDINPDNILLSYDDSKPGGILGDFGIAKLLDQVNSLPGAGGRYLYFAPECFMNIYLPSSDVFSAGVVLYKILTGVHPWQYDFDHYTLDDNEEVSKMITSGRKEEPKKPSLFNENVDSKIDKVVMKSLEKNMENRYRTASSFLKALQDACIIEDLSHGYWLEQNLISVN